MIYQRFYTILLTAVLCLTAVHAWADNEWTSGNCTVRLVGDSMTVLGSGKMADYNATEAPWYSENLAVKKIVIQEGVTKIGAKAFANFYKLASVAIPNSVDSIGGKAFVNCYKLTSLSLNENSSLRSIGEAAFSHCSGLSSFTVLRSLDSVGDYAFEYCSKLKSFTIPEGVSFISKGLFMGCSGLTSINLHAGLTAINRSAFQGCSGLTELAIPPGVTTIGACAFQACKGLKTIAIPGSVTTIDDLAFAHCSAAENVYCYADINSLSWRIDASDFQSGIKTSIHVIDVPAWQKKYGNSIKHFVELEVKASGNCGAQGDNVKWFLYQGGVVIISGKGEMADLGTQEKDPWASMLRQITSVHIKEGVTWLSKRAFTSAKSLVYASLPSTLKRLSDAFFECEGLKFVKLSEGLEVIDEYAFGHCHSLTNVYIPASVKTIGELAFEDCTSLKTATFAEKSRLKVISSHMLRDCSKLEKVNIPDSVTTIGVCAFSESKIIKEVTITANSQLQTIGNYAFRDKRKLLTFTIPSGVTKIGECAFQDCMVMADVYCYADPEKLTWVTPSEDFMPNKATRFYVTDVAVWEKKFPNANVTFVDAQKGSTRGTEGTTSVSERVTSEMATAHWYTLDGRKLTGKPTRKGLYIVNGRKVVIK